MTRLFLFIFTLLSSQLIGQQITLTNINTNSSTSYNIGVINFNGANVNFQMINGGNVIYNAQYKPQQNRFVIPGFQLGSASFPYSGSNCVYQNTNNTFTLTLTQSAINALNVDCNNCPVLGNGANHIVDININPNDTLLIEATQGTNGFIAELGGGDEDITDDVRFTISGVDASFFTFSTSSYNNITGEVYITDLESTSPLNNNRYDFLLTLEDIGGLTMTVPVVVCINSNAKPKVYNNSYLSKIYINTKKNIATLFSNQITINNADFIVYDLYGKPIVNGTTSNVGKFEIPSSTSTGIYVIWVNKDGVSRYTKFYYYNKL